MKQKSKYVAELEEELDSVKSDKVKLIKALEKAIRVIRYKGCCTGLAMAKDERSEIVMSLESVLKDTELKTPKDVNFIYYGSPRIGRYFHISPEKFSANVKK